MFRHELVGLMIPYERWVMIAFAYAGYVLVGVMGALTWYVGCRAWGPKFAAVILVLGSMGTSLIWADGLAHLGKALILGPCNPWYAACNGEHEGWTAVTTSDDAATVTLWNQVKCGPPPGGSAHPLLPWWGNPVAGSWCVNRSASGPVSWSEDDAHALLFLPSRGVAVAVRRGDWPLLMSPNLSATLGTRASVGTP